MSRLRVLLISSFVVFIICVLLAYFSGSSMLLGLFKALVSACLVVIFLLVANFFLVKYIPDFFEDDSKIDVTDSSAVGSSLDIRIDDSSLSSVEHAVGLSSSEEPVSSSSSFEGVEGIQGLEDTKKESVGYEPSVSSDVKSADFTNENEDLSNENGDLGDSSIDNMQKPALEVERAVNVDDVELSQAELTQTIEKDVDRLEELPDLQEFVDASNLNVEQTRGDELMSTGTQSFFATDLSEDVTDTNLMAKAVRTVLKREI